jgi:hypothetical protein
MKRICATAMTPTVGAAPTTGVAGMKAAVRRSAGWRGQRRLSCSTVHVLARRLNVSVRHIGQICNEESIKIIYCQLGCF